MSDFTHFNEQGRAKMVDVGEKPISQRVAVAAGRVLVNENTFALIRSVGMKKGDVLVVFSYSGQSGICIDMARLANERGLILIALTNTKRARSTGSHHSSGKCLYEYADIVIENIGNSADASVEVEGFELPVAPTSTVIGSTIINAIVARTVEILVHKGVTPEVFAGGDSECNCEIDNRYVRKYLGDIKFL